MRYKAKDLVAMFASYKANQEVEFCIFGEDEVCILSDYVDHGVVYVDIGTAEQNKLNNERAAGF